MQKKRGISLIVLVITIIVMIILAAAIILSLNNAGIIGNANKAVEMTDEANVKQIAQLGWSDAYIEHREDVAKLREGVEKALTDSGLNPDDYGMIVTTKGVDIVKGWLQDKTIVVKGNTTLKVGDIINYNEGIDSYNAGWKVLGAENGELLIMSADRVSTLELGNKQDIVEAKEDYMTGIKQLNDICISYGKGKNATGARSINVDDVNRVTGYDPEEAKDDTVNRYGNVVTYYWDGTSEPYYETTNDMKGNLGATQYEIEHKGTFCYFNGNEFVTSKLSDTENTGASKTNLKKIATITCDFYLYYARTLRGSNASSYPTLGLETNSKAYKMLFRNLQDNANSTYWLASQAIVTSTWYVGHGFRFVEDGMVRSRNTVNSDIDAGESIEAGSNNVYAVVSLNKNITLTGNSNDGWSY